MRKVTMYSMEWCPYCNSAQRLLEGKGVPLEKISVDRAPELYKKMVQMSGRRTVPQIFVGKTHIGGYDDLAELDASGNLDPMLAD